MTELFPYPGTKFWLDSPRRNSRLQIITEIYKRIRSYPSLSIECFHVTSSPSRLQRKTENSRHVGVQQDRSFYGDLHNMSDIMLLKCDKSDKTPLVRKLNSYINAYLCVFFKSIWHILLITYCTSCTPRWLRNCDHVMKTLYTGQTLKNHPWVVLFY